MSWQLGSFVLLALVLLGGFLWYERERPPARVLALVAALAALAVVGRLAFAAFPNVKPTTDIVLFSGYTLGAVPGFAVGAVTALVSNVFLSQGPWTVWQMAGWGGVGAGAALLARMARRREPSRVWLAVACGFAGFAFGAWMDVYQWTLASRQDLDSYLAVSASSLPYNLAHAIGNVLFCLVIGPAFIRALRRYRARLEVRWEKAPPRAAAAAAAVVIALAVAAGAGAPPAQAASAGSKAASYLLRAQNRDGGFPGAPKQGSSPLVTGWSALGLASARHNPRDVHRKHGRSVSRYLAGSPASMSDIGSIERTILVLKSAGLSPRKFAGRDLVAKVKAKRRKDGSIAGFVSYTAFGVLALRAAGQTGVSAQASYLVRAQGSDGGFGIATSAASDPDMTGAVLQALAAAGRATGGVKSRAVSFLRARQNADGGFGALRGAQLERPVHRLRRPGPGGRPRGLGGRRPRHRLPEAPPARRRQHPLLAHQRADAGLGDGPGADGAAPQAAADSHGAAQEAPLARGGRGRREPHGAEGRARGARAAGDGEGQDEDQGPERRAQRRRGPRGRAHPGPGRLHTQDRPGPQDPPGGPFGEGRARLARGAGHRARAGGGVPHAQAARPLHRG